MSIMQAMMGVRQICGLISSLILFFLLSSCASSRLETGPKIRVAIRNGSLKIHDIPLEKYVMGVLEKEVPANWPPEALKAQAVASRTYALYRREHPRNEKFDIDSNVSDQAFVKKRHHPRSIEEAVSETEDQVLTYNGNLLPAFFHSCCGGTNEPADKVWPGPYQLPLLSPHDDPHCEACPRSHWEVSIPRQELTELLDARGHTLEDPWALEVSERNDSGRVTQVTFRFKKGELALPGTTFREILGYDRLPSTLFEITSPEDPIVFSGRGSGHGVGLCQWGARGMADEGRSALEILEFYYPGADVTSIDQAFKPQSGAEGEATQAPTNDPVGEIINNEDSSL